MFRVRKNRSEKYQNRKDVTVVNALLGVLLITAVLLVAIGLTAQIIFGDGAR